jgi:hypothetical protein
VLAREDNVAQFQGRQKINFLMPGIFAALAIFYALPFLMKLEFVGVRDWDLFTTMAAVPVSAILDFGQFPFWNMYLGGGNILFHHPEVLVISPFFPLYLILGPVIGLKLQVAICYFLGFYGSYLLARRLRMSMMAAAMVAVAYFGSVHFALHIAEGHMPFTHFCYLPWFVYFVFDDQKSVRSVILAGVVLALMILGNGAAIPMLYTLFFSALVFALCALTTGRIAPVVRWAGAVVVGLGLAAVKLVPMLIYLFQNKWPGNPEESIPVAALGSIFFGWEHSLFAENFDGQFWAWHEYGAYLSPLLVILAVAALLKSFRRFWPWLALLVFFLLLGLGDFGALSPWAILSQWPGFSSARCTGRAFQMVILTTAILGGFGLDTLRVFFSQRQAQWTKYVTGAVVAIVMGSNLLLAWPIMASAFPQEPQSVTRADRFQQVVNDELAFTNFRANRGSLKTPWLSAYHPSRGVVDAAGTAHMEHFLSGQATVTRSDYSPNRIEYVLNVTQPGEMIIGMGHDPGWSVADGRSLRAEQGLLAFPIQSGEDRIVLNYRPPYLYLGLTLSLMWLVGLGIVWRRWAKSLAGVLTF